MSNYDQHLWRVHPSEYQSSIEKWRDRFPVAPPVPQDNPLPMDVDVYNDQEDGRIISVREVVRKLLDESRFFDQVNDLNSYDQKFVSDSLTSIMNARLKGFVTFEEFKSIAEDLLFNLLNEHLNPQYSQEAIELVENFSQSEPLQACYLKRTNMLIEPKTITLNEQKVGQYVDLKELSKIILKNASIVQSIVDEEKRIPQHKFEKYNSELCCSVERQKLLFGKLRIELGIDDFTVTNQSRKFLVVYGVFTNIPVKERLKRRDIFLIAIADRDALKNANVTLNEFLKELVDDLEYLMEFGLPIRVEYSSGLKKTITIKAALTALVGDNLGQYELLGLRTTFFKGFICRHCAYTHEDIQHCTESIKKLLGSKQDIEDYKVAVDEALELCRQMEEARIANPNLSEKTLKKRFSPKNRFGVVKECVFTRLVHLNIWNISPADVLHDLAEGVIPRILDIILRHGIDISKLPVMNNKRRSSFRWKHEQIKQKLETFPLLNGNIKVSLKTKKPFLNFHGKAVQKLEVFSRLLEIFPIELNCDKDDPAFRLYLALHEFCSISFSFEVSEEDLKKLDRNAKEIIELIMLLEGDKEDEELEEEEDDQTDEVQQENVDFEVPVTVDYEDYEEEEDEDDDDDDVEGQTKTKSKQYLVFSKLHTLLHYSELIRRYGPLVLFSTLKYERKHVFFKNLSDIMRNFINPTLTFAKHHQMALVMVLLQFDFWKTDFFADDNIDDIGSFEGKLKVPHSRLKSGLYPHKLNKNILRKINFRQDSRREYWIHPQSFVKTEIDGIKTIYAYGPIYELRSSDKKGPMPYVINKKHNNLYVDMRYMFYKNDFLVTRNDNNTMKCHIVRGLM